MTKRELYDTVKDIPEDAWPEGVFWFAGDWYDSEAYEIPLCLHHAELLFIGSMATWLASLAFIVETYYTHQDGRTRIALSGTGAIDRKMAMETPLYGRSITEALAFACKTVNAVPGRKESNDAVR